MSVSFLFPGLQIEKNPTLPDFHRCATTAHAYIVELKYLKPDATENFAQKQWDETVEQIKGYSLFRMEEVVG